MKIFMACPAPAGSRKGNRVTAVRWARILKRLGHRLTIAARYGGSACDVLIALHARKSYEAIRDYHRLHQRGPLIVALTGTDLYRDIRISRQAQRSLELADRLILLQPCGFDELSPPLRSKARVIYQSVEWPRLRPPKSRKYFAVCVLGHLRHEKDPLRAALALRLLPATSRVRVTHAGEALSPALAKQARAAMARDPRYRWLGEVPRWKARRILARSHALVLSSRMEGGANVVSEAIAAGVPVLASHIPGNVGLLGERYPGYYPVADTQALARLFQRAESDERFYAGLAEWCARLAPLVDPARERGAWEKLLDEVVPQAVKLSFSREPPASAGLTRSPGARG
jgi:putative glycosyltransferase (TIGR04348 family)